MKQLIKEYLEFYSESQGILPEKIKEYNEKYQVEGLDIDDLYQLAYESSTRSAHHVKQNSRERCKEILENIEKVDGDYSKMALITSLKGFKAPTGSVILTVMAPETHAIVDTRVWASLERLGYLEGRRESFGPEHYVQMIEPIREIAEETGYTTEQVGYALFAYDVDKREGTLH